MGAFVLCADTACRQRSLKEAEYSEGWRVGDVLCIVKQRVRLNAEKPIDEVEKKLAASEGVVIMILSSVTSVVVEGSIHQSQCAFFVLPLLYI